MDDEPGDSALPAESTEAAAGSTGGYVADMADMAPVPLPVAAPVEAEESEEDMGNVSWRVFHLPSRELTYPPDKAYLKMIFLFPMWDMLISWRVCILAGRSADRDELKSAAKVRVEHQPLLADVFFCMFVSWDGIRWFWEK